MIKINRKSWLTNAEATARLNARFPGRAKPINADYVRDLVRQGRITKMQFDDRTNLYLEADIDSIIIREGAGRHKGSADKLPRSAGRVNGP